jgi:cytochrome c
MERSWVGLVDDRQGQRIIHADIQSCPLPTAIAEHREALNYGAQRPTRLTFRIYCPSPEAAHMHPEDDTSPPRPRWLAVALIVAVVMVSAGMLTVGWRTLQAGSIEGKAIESSDVAMASTSNGVAPTSPAAPLAAGLTAVNASGCMRCHGVDRRYVGPAFSQVAARYQGRPGAVDYLAGKIRNGGAGEWGRALMPRHPQLSEAQARHMAQWVMSLPPPTQ